MNNRYNVNLVLPSPLELTLEIGKSKKKKFSSLKYKGNLIKKIETSILPEYLNDGDILEVILQDNVIIKKDDNQQIVCISGQILDANILVDIINEDNNVKIKFDDLVLDIKDINYFGDLFTRTYKYFCEKRTSYKAFISGINEIKCVRYVNTHEHTEYSRLDGMTKIKELAKKCEYATAITDHGNMTGALKFDAAMRENGKKPLIGIEGYIEEIDDNIFKDIFVDINEDYKKSHFKKEHIILIAKNNIGYKNLLKLASLSWNNFYGKNHITYRDLKKYSEGIVTTSACLGSTIGKTTTEDEKAIKNAFFNELGIEKFKHYNNIGEDYDILDDDDYKLSSSEKDFLIKTFNYTNDHLTKNDIESLIKGKENKFPKTKEEIEKYGYRARLYIEKMIELFGRDDFYIEIQRHKFFSEEHYESILLDLALEYNLKIISGIDNHYLNKEDAPIHEMWLCESTKKNLDDPTRLKFPGEGYWLFNSDEALELYADLPEALENSLEVADKCDVDLSHKGYELPTFPLPEGYGDTKEEQIRYFKTKVLEGYKNRFLGTEKYNDPVYTNRMSFEMNTILNMGFESYFLIVQDYISWAKDNNVADNLEKYFPKAHYNWDNIPDAIKNKTDEIYVGPGRGSAAGSLVAYCLGITNINPIDYDLLFERFLNPDRISMPDIDTDFEDSERERVIDYCKAKYGEKAVSRIGTIGVLAAKGIIRSLQRIEGKDVALANKICKTIPNTPGITLEGAKTDSPEFKTLYEEDTEIKELVDNAEKLEGLAKTVGQHACGIIIAPSEVNNYVPQQLLKNAKTGEKELTTQFTGPECEDNGLLKMDFLGLRTLGVLHEGVDDINKIRENKIDLTSIPIDDMETMKFLSTGETDGVFQFESSFMKDIVKKMLQDINTNNTLNGKICFNRLTDATALGRPGPMATIPDYVQNLLHPDAIKLTNTPLDEILKPTYGIIVYQEQVMNAVKALAGFSAGDADAVRKAMGKKLLDKMAVLREMFIYGNQEKHIPGCVKNGYDEQWAIELWDRMAEFAKYAFNKSHAVAYTYLSMKTAWVSKYYPNIFYKINLNSFINDAKKIKQYINTARKRGIEVLSPDVNESEMTFSIDFNNYTTNSPIRFGLKGIKTLGESSKYIITEREKNGKYISFRDFVERMLLNYPIGKKSIEALIMSGACDSFEGTRKNKVDALDKMVDAIKAEANEIKKGQMTIIELAKELNQTSVLNQIEELNRIEYNLNDSYSLEVELKAEKEYTGFYISRHPIDEYKEYLINRGVSDIIDLIETTEEEIVEITDEEQENLIIEDNSKNNNKTIFVGGIIKNIETHFSKKNGSKLITFMLEDDTAEMKAVAFSKTVELYENRIIEDNIVICSGKLVTDDFGTQLIVEKIDSIQNDKLANKNTLSINIPSIGDNREMIQRVKNIVDNNKVDYKSFKVVVNYIWNNKKRTVTVYIKNKQTVADELAKIVGQDNIKYL